MENRFGIGYCSGRIDWKKFPASIPKALGHPLPSYYTRARAHPPPNFQKMEIKKNLKKIKKIAKKVLTNVFLCGTMGTVQEGTPRDEQTTNKRRI
jgi:hypothetical protein